MIVATIIPAIAVICIIMIVHCIKAVRRAGYGWLKKRWADYVIFVLAFTSFMFSVGISIRIAIFVSDHNVPIDVIMGGNVFNIALFLLPGFLFVVSLVLAVRILLSRHEE